MFRLVSAGILYLIGVSIVLTIKPNFMFSEDGSWKEFGIGRNTRTHTWMPFWLFAVLWALVSYIIVSILMILTGYKQEKQSISVTPEVIQNLPATSDEVVDEVVNVLPEDLEVSSIKPKRNRSKLGSRMADGYYMLNRRATELSGGIPKYVYLGKALPN
jgi:hypothetical protein